MRQCQRGRRQDGGEQGVPPPHNSFAAKTQRTEVHLLRESDVQNVLKFDVSYWNSDSKSFYQNMPVKFFIIYVPSQQLQGQLQTQHSVDTSNYIMDKHNIKSQANYTQALEENTLLQKSKQTNDVIQSNSLLFMC
jgi:hypothetical protein